MKENNSASQNLLQACKDNNLDGVKKALDNGADVKAKSDIGGTPLTLASVNSKKEIIELLPSLSPIPKENPTTRAKVKKICLDFHYKVKFEKKIALNYLRQA